MIRQFIILLFFPSWIMTVDYCSICSDHTMCKYNGPGPACGHDRTSGVSKKEVREILKVHNDFRSVVASGREKRGSPGPQPSAANMNALIWDDHLAKVAQRWADQCTFQHDFCRQDPRFQVGQNIYFATGYPTVNWTQAISAWYQEVSQFDSRTVDKFIFQFTTGHYTQLVWGKTRYIGCGSTSYYSGFYKTSDYEQQEYILPTVPQNQPFTNDNYSSRDDLTSSYSHLPLSNITNNDGRHDFDEKLPHIRVKKWIDEEWRGTIYNNLGRNHILVCNYGPSGNFLYQPVYRRGKHCSQCPFGFRCINELCV